jgi:hypothetical protein
MGRVLSIVNRLCPVVLDRRPGSAGNDEAVGYVARRLDDAGWDVSLPEFDCLDWVGGDSSVYVGEALRGPRRCVGGLPAGRGVHRGSDGTKVECPRLAAWREPAILAGHI